MVQHTRTLERVAQRKDMVQYHTLALRTPQGCTPSDCRNSTCNAGFR
jgi:hypothetical protein